MSPTDAKRIVTLFAFVGGGLNSLRVVRAGRGVEVPRVLIGIGIATLMMSLLAEIPKMSVVVGPMAVTALTVSILYSGTPDLIVNALGTAPKKPGGVPSITGIMKAEE